MANYIIEAASGGTVRHQAGSDGTGSGASIQALATSDGWTSGDTITLDGGGSFGQSLATGLWTVDFDCTIQIFRAPILTASGSSGGDDTISIEASDVVVQSLDGTSVTLKNTGSNGGVLVFDAANAAANLSGIVWTAPAVVDAVSSGGVNPIKFVQDSTYRVSVRMDDVEISAGNGLPDGFTLSGSPTTGGVIELNRCVARGCNSLANSNGFSFDGRCLAILTDCESYDSGGPGIVGGAAAGFTSRIWVRGGVVARTAQHASASAQTYAVYAEQVTDLTIEDCTSGIFLTGASSNAGSGYVRRTRIYRDQSRYTGTDDNNLCRAIEIDVLNWDITGNHIKGFRWGKSASYTHIGIYNNTATGFVGTIADNTFENVAMCCWFSGQGGSLIIDGNSVYNDALTVLDAADTAHVFYVVGAGAAPNQLRADIVNNVVFHDLAYTTNVYLVRASGTSTLQGKSEGNYWYKGHTTRFTGWTAGSSDASPAVDSANEPIFNVDGDGELTDGLQTLASPALLFAGASGLFERAELAAAIAEVNVVQVNGVAVTDIEDFKADVSGLPTAADIWNYLAASATTSGSLGKRIADNLDAAISSRSDFDESTDGVGVVGFDTVSQGQLEGFVDNALRAIDLHKLAFATAGGSAAAGSFVRTLIDNLASAMGATFDGATDSQEALRNRIDAGLGATFDTSTDSNEAIRNRGDAAWATGAGSELTGGLTIAISVVDEDDAAIPNARISVKSADGTTTHQTLICDANGQATINPEDGTEYRIVTIASGYVFDDIQETWTEDGAYEIAGESQTIAPPANPDEIVVYEYVSNPNTTIVAEAIPNQLNGSGESVSTAPIVFDVDAGTATATLFQGVRYRFRADLLGLSEVVETPAASTVKLSSIVTGI